VLRGGVDQTLAAGQHTTATISPHAPRRFVQLEERALDEAEMVRGALVLLCCVVLLGARAGS